MNLPKRLIDKFARGECTDAELAEVALWLQDGETGDIPFIPGNREAIWRKIEARRMPVRRLPLRWVAAAAAVIMAGAAVYGLRLLNAPRELTVQVAKGKTTRLVLPDSSVVFLKGPSMFRYPSRFGSGARIVHLTGNGAFEVQGNAGSPFTVVSGSVKTTALGTSFEVDAPEGSDEVNVWLRYGKVVVSRDRDSLYLKPGEAIGYSSTKRTLHRAAPDAYRSGVLYFNRAGLEEVITKLENYYNIHIVADSALTGREWQVTGEFVREDPEFVIRNIAFIADVKYRIKGDSLWLMPQTNQQEP